MVSRQGEHVRAAPLAVQGQSWDVLAESVLAGSCVALATGDWSWVRKNSADCRRVKSRRRPERALGIGLDQASEPAPARRLWDRSLRSGWSALFLRHKASRRAPIPRGWRWAERGQTGIGGPDSGDRSSVRSDIGLYSRVGRIAAPRGISCTRLAFSLKVQPTPSMRYSTNRETATRRRTPSCS